MYQALQNYMKKYIVEKIKGSIEQLKADWATNYVAKAWHETKDNSESKKQVDSSIFNMGQIEEKIAWMEELLKKES